MKTPHPRSRFVVLGLMVGVAACSAGSTFAITDGGAQDGTGPNGDDGGNPTGCPESPPSQGSPCAVAGLRCGWCPVFATCTGGSWNVMETAIACPAPASDAGSCQAPPSDVAACQTASDCAIVYGGCYCGSQPAIGVAKKHEAARSACEQQAASTCALGCANSPGHRAQDGNTDLDGGTIAVHCEMDGGVGTCLTYVP
jgi:hypothetical protein